MHEVSGATFVPTCLYRQICQHIASNDPFNQPEQRTRRIARRSGSGQRAIGGDGTVVAGEDGTDAAQLCRAIAVKLITADVGRDFVIASVELQQGAVAAMAQQARRGEGMPLQPLEQVMPLEEHLQAVAAAVAPHDITAACCLNQSRLIRHAVGGGLQCNKIADRVVCEHADDIVACQHTAPVRD